MTLPPAVCTVGWYMNTATHDTPTPAATQRPATNLAEAIDLLTKQQHYDGELPQFVGDLISQYPHLVLREIVTRRSDYIGKVLGSYRGEV